ncbi:MgtC/SapB family protein [Frisingicoccus sp.]|uniref:MgtC/SapB family protein n=1 Tax=Frisingicoccus sp. TaxID=1918627 RepID=UPI0025C1836D|nr:MgtC/SapB family protein [Frisingicoccus sp.]
MEVFTSINTYLHTFCVPVVFIRLLMAAACGGGIGYLRSVKKRGAGFKTHILVCVGAALIMMTGQYIYAYVSGGNGDVARLAAQVVSGVGFLGAGTIMVTGGNQIKGLTTAAGLWASSGIGLAIGIGFYSGGFFATLIVFFVYNFMERVDEYAYEHSRVYDLYVEFESRQYITPFMLEMKKNGFKFLSIQLSKSKKNKDDIVSATMSIEVNTKSKGVDVHKIIENLEGVNSVEEI